MNTLQIVLFGLPSAGKSSLLGALSLAAQSQSDTLQVKLEDPTGKLSELQKATYGSRPPETKDEVVSLPLRMKGDDGEVELTIFDCDGRVAEAYVSQGRSLSDRAPLAQALLGADAVVFAADASVPENRLEIDFKHFHQFLTLLEQTRGLNTDFAGLPVFLVLTKCDLLAEANAGFSQWVETLEEKKRQVGQHFREFLARQGDSGGFGEIEMRIHATAVKRPGFVLQPGELAKSSHRHANKVIPYGVAELFRQALAEATEFREDRRLSTHQLFFTTMALITLVSFLGFLAFWMATTQPDPGVKRLEEALRQAVPNLNAPPQDRLRGSLDARIHQLRHLQDDPDFPKLSSSRREEIRQALAEMEAYRQLQQQLQLSVKLPYLAKDEAELKGFQTALTEFRFPESYTETWKETRLAKRVETIRQEYADLDRNLADEKAWLQGRIREGKDLIIQANKLDNKILAGEKLSANEFNAWNHDLSRFLTQPGRMHPDQNLSGVSKFIYESFSMFQPIRALHKDWEGLKRDLRSAQAKLEKRKNGSGE